MSKFKDTIDIFPILYAITVKKNLMEIVIFSRQNHVKIYSKYT